MNNKLKKQQEGTTQQPIILNAQDLPPEYIEKIRNDALLMDVAYQKHDVNADIETKRKHYQEKILSNDSYSDAHKHFLLNQVHLKEAWNRDSGLQGLVFETSDICVVALSGTGSGLNMDTFQDMFWADFVETAITDGKPVTQITDCLHMIERSMANGIIPKNKEIKIIGHSLGGNIVFNIKHHLGKPVVSITLHSAGKIRSLKDHLKNPSENKAAGQQTLYQVLTAARIIAPLSEFVVGGKGKEKIIKEITTMQKACQRSLDRIQKGATLPKDPNHVHLANKNGISFLNEMGDLSAGMIINVPGDAGHGISSFVGNCDRLLKQHKERDIALGHGTQTRSLKLLASATLIELNDARKNNDNPLEKAAIEKEITRCKKAIKALGGDEKLLRKESYTMIMHYLHKGEPLAGISEKEQTLIQEYVQSIKDGGRVQQRRTYGLLLSSTEQRLIKEGKIRLLPKENYQSGYVENQSVIRNMEIRHFKSTLFGQTEETIRQLKGAKEKKLSMNEVRRNTLAQYAPGNTEIIEALDDAIDLGKKELQAIKNHQIWHPSKKEPVMPLSELPEAKQLSKIDQDHGLSSERKQEAKKQLYKQVMEEITQNDKANKIMEHQEHVTPEMLGARKSYNKAKKQFAEGLAKDLARDVGKNMVRPHVMPSGDAVSDSNRSAKQQDPKMKNIEEKQVLLEKTEKDIARLDKKIESLKTSRHVDEEMLKATIAYRDMQKQFQSKLQKDIAAQQRSYYQNPSIDSYDMEPQDELKTLHPLKKLRKDLSILKDRYFNPKDLDRMQELDKVLGHLRGGNGSKVGLSKHKVEGGESLTVIAKNNNTTVEQLVADNNIQDPNKIQVGQVLIVRESTFRDYSIQDKDTLSEIAEKTGTTVKWLVENNNIQNPDKIKAGATLKVPGSTPPSGQRSDRVLQPDTYGHRGGSNDDYEDMDFHQIDTSSDNVADTSGNGGGSFYKVQAGDSASKVAEKHGIDLDDLIKDNGIDDPDKIYEGEDLYIRDKDDTSDDDSSIRSYQESDVYKQWMPDMHINPDWRSLKPKQGDKVPFIGSIGPVKGPTTPILYGPRSWPDLRTVTASQTKMVLLDDRWKKSDGFFAS